MNYNTIYILNLYELSNFDQVIDVVSGTIASGGKRTTHDTHANSLLLN